jgi:hypothetical protein
MKRSAVIGLVVVIVLAAGAYYFLQTPPAPPPAAPPAAAQPAIEHPLGPAPEAALPKLADSDDTLGAALAALVHAPTLPDVFFPTQLAHRFVATVDNLPREQIAAGVRFVRPAAGTLAVAGHEGALTLAADNGARYARYLELVRTVDPAAAVTLYRRYYPLFQQAYEELGYPGHYFNDRVVVVIDNLLATPEPAGPVALVHPSVMFKFADPATEGLSAGQKALIRLGPDNAREVKEKLRAIRALIATQPHA